jgi:hypothetical protein
MTRDIPEPDLDHSSECLPERWGRRGEPCPRQAQRVAPS